MSLADVSRDAVLAAVAEFDERTREAFLAQYGFGKARSYFLVYNGRFYDSKAIMGAAHGYATGRPLRAADFSGGEQTVAARLSTLGFEVRDRDELSRRVDQIGLGEIEGVRVGDTFRDRRELANRGVHRALQAGIVGNGKNGAESIVVSGGYEDDVDHGSLIIYTGHGGRDQAGRQIEDQSFESSGNSALMTSHLAGTPVRVIRGANAKSVHAPTTGYRYDGLFRVESRWREPGRRGHYVCRYTLVRIDASTTESVAEPMIEVRPPEHPQPTGNDVPDRRWVVTQRVVRSTKVTSYVKSLYDDTCQACGMRLLIGERRYSEGAHIWPLGTPHAGPDISENVLCLCANCHVLFDNGALIIADDFTIRLNGKSAGTLHVRPDHTIGLQYLAYHRSIFM